MMRTRWERYSSPCYILPQAISEETKKPEQGLRLFVFVFREKHNILCSAKKRSCFSAFFFGKWPLSGKESCAIMTVTDEFGEKPMNIESISLDRPDVHKLLLAANGDAALLYIYLKAGNPIAGAEEALHLTAERIRCAAATLRQLGLHQEEKPAHILPGERPTYSERDVLEASGDTDFRSLCGEVQRLLGRTLNTEELKILLGFIRYLGLGTDVISVLICYCKDRARQRGNLRNPSLRAIEKEAYAWAERGIDSMEEAVAFIQTQNQRNSRLHQLMNLLQIRGRTLTAAEERYAGSWIEMGFEDEVITMAYERTCLNTGGLNWAYMNKILQRWHEAGLHTAEEVRSGDRKPGAAAPAGQRQLDTDEIEAIRRMMREG